MIKNQSLIKVTLASLMLATLTGCPFDDDDDDAPVVVMPDPMPEPMEYSYDVTVTNLTYAQPMSPIAGILHQDNKFWEIGTAASNALEVMAEGGDNSDLTGLAEALVSTSTDGILAPGASATFSLTTTDMTASYLTVATMLVNTNDAFSGLTGMDLSSLAVDQSHAMNLGVYDAGTELNSEAMGTIPGPADSGTGYDSERNDIADVVTMHQGIVSMDDGLSTSVLTQAHRFDNPALRITITRTK